jgi:hypothetical protein
MRMIKQYKLALVRVKEKETILTLQLCKTWGRIRIRNGIKMESWVRPGSASKRCRKLTTDTTDHPPPLFVIFISTYKNCQISIVNIQNQDAHLDVNGAVDDGELREGERAGLHHEGHVGQLDPSLLAHTLQLLQQPETKKVLTKASFDTMKFEERQKKQFVQALKRLSNAMDLAFDDMHGQF